MSLPIRFGDLRFQAGMEDFPIRAEFGATRRIDLDGPHFDTDFPTGGWLFNTDNFGGETITIAPLLGGSVPYENGWKIQLGFSLYPIRCAGRTEEGASYGDLDVWNFGAGNVEDVKANLTLSHFTGTRTRVVARVVKQEDEPAVDPAASASFITNDVDTNGDRWWQIWEQYDDEPATIPMTIGLFGFRHDGSEPFISGWHLDALGGGDSYTYTATNNTEAVQNIVIDMTDWAKCYVANKNNYAGFCWVVTPATAAHLVAEVVDAPGDIARVLWGMYASGDWTRSIQGYRQDAPDVPIAYVEGEITGWTLSWQDAAIGVEDLEMGGEVSLPAGFHVGPSPYGPGMGAV